MRKRTLPLALATPLAAVAALAAPGSGAAQTPSLPRMTIVMTGKTIAVGGTLESGAVEIVSTTTGERQGTPVLVRLHPGVAPVQLLSFLGSPAARDLNNAARYGTIVFGTEADRGTADAETVLRPGRYVALDINQSHGPPPHTAFTISQTAHPAALPKPQATIRATEFAFRGPATLHEGELVRFENDGFLVHMITGIAARNAASAREIVRLLRAGKDKQAQRLPVGGYEFENVVSTGGLVQLRLHVKPGTWILACFMDTQDGREHTRLGMLRVVRIVD